MPNKEQFMKSETYRKDRDLLAALLADDKKYTTKDVDRILTRYKKGRVD